MRELADRLSSISFAVWTSACLGLCGATLPTVAAAQTRGARQLTTTGAAYAKISPNGNWVMFQTSNNGVTALGIVSTVPSAKPSILVTDASLTQFVWAPDSAGIYYQVGANINYIRSVGGTPKQIATVSGANPRMWGVDPKDKVLFGTRADSNRANAIFTAPTDSSTKPVDILYSKSLFFDQLTVDPAGTTLAYTAQTTGVPHAPTDIRSIGLDGKNDLSLSGALPRTGVDVALPRQLAWVDAGKTLLFTAVDSAATTWTLMRVTTASSTPVPLTAPPQHFWESGISGDRKTLVCYGTTFHSHTVPYVMPAAGGGRIPLEPELDWVVAGPPTVSVGGLHVAFAGYPVGQTGARHDVRLIELDREIRVAPRPALGAKLTFELPLLFGEKGTLYLSTGLGSVDPKQQFQLPGFRYAVAIDATVLLPLISGTGSGAPLSFTATVPADTALIGFTVYLQGLRVKTTNPDAGDFTRYVELQFLK